MAKKATKKTAKKPAKKTAKKVAKKTARKTAKPPAKKKAAAKTARAASSKSTSASKKTKITGSAANSRRSGSGVSLMAAAKPANRKLTPNQKRGLRDSLLTMREQLTNQINSLRGDSLTRNDEVNPAEDGTDAFERQFALSVASTENDSVVEIDDALRRLDEGKYGKCETCEQLINMARLKALPFVRMCITCQSEEEKKHGPYRQASVRRGL